MQVLAIAQSRVNASIHKFVICFYGRLPCAATSSCHECHQCHQYHLFHDRSMSQCGSLPEVFFERHNSVGYETQLAGADSQFTQHLGFHGFHMFHRRSLWTLQINMNQWDALHNCVARLCITVCKLPRHVCSAPCQADIVRCHLHGQFAENIRKLCQTNKTL